MPKYRNNFEAKIGKTLPANFQYETIKIPYQLTCNYLPDWVDEANKEIIEGKGLFTAEDRRKHKAIKAQYPDWNVTIVFQNPDRKLTKASSTSYSDWCEKNGIAWRKA